MSPTDSRTLILGREPAVLAEVIASALVLANLFFLPFLDDRLQGAINAVVVGAASLYIAVRVRSDKLLPILLGFAKVLVALVVAFGVEIPDTQQAAILTFISLVAGMFVRTQVAAPVTVDGHPLYGAV
jgi:hypothetical protein